MTFSGVTGLAIDPGRRIWVTNQSNLRYSVPIPLNPTGRNRRDVSGEASIPAHRGPNACSSGSWSMIRGISGW